MMYHPHVSLHSRLHCSTCLGVFSVFSCLSDLGLQTQSPAEQACALLAAHKRPFLFQQHLSRFDYACPSALPAQEWPHILITDCLHTASLSP